MERSIGSPLSCLILHFFEKMALFSAKKKPFNTCKSDDGSRLLVAKRNYPSSFSTWRKQEFCERSFARFLGVSTGK